MKKDGFGKGNWGSAKQVYKKKGDPDPEEIPREEEVRDERPPPRKRYEKYHNEEYKGEENKEGKYEGR
jgi:hypothetical protein